MVDDFYGVLDRIDEIRKRFGLKKNTVPQNTSAENSFSDELQKAVRGKESADVEISERDRINSIADYYASRNHLSPSLVRAVIDAESGYDETAVSPKGAMGLMQLMPSTVSALGVRDPFSAEDNIRGGTELLKQLLGRYQGNYEKALAAYNAGTAAVDRAGGIPDYEETRNYVSKILKQTGERQP